MLRWLVVFDDGSREWVSAYTEEDALVELVWDEARVVSIECLGPAYED